MDVNARAVGGPAFSLTARDTGPQHLAIVATLASIALLSYLLRAFMVGKLRRRFGIVEDFFMMMSALMILGALVTYVVAIRLGLGKLHQDLIHSTDKSIEMGRWLWALQTFHISGMGFVRISAIAYLVSAHNGAKPIWCSLLPFVVLLSLGWVVALWTQCFPVEIGWDTFRVVGTASEKLLDGECFSAHGSRSWAITNFTINMVISVVLWLSTLPIIGTGFLSRKRNIYNLVAIGILVVACAASIVRLRMVVTSWATVGYRNFYDLSFITWAVVELSAWVLAANIPPVYSLFAAARKSKRPAISAPVTDSFVHTAGSTYDGESCNSRHSSQTVIYRPNTAYFPGGGEGAMRFHDDESNLTFDIKTPSTRSPAKSCKTGKSSTEDVRRVSDWSQFSGFTYYTNATSEEEDEEKEERRRRVVSTELEEIVRSLGIGRPSNMEIQQDPEKEGEKAAASDEEKDDKGKGEGSGNSGDDADSVSLQSEADSSEVTVSRSRARS